MLNVITVVWVLSAPDARPSTAELESSPAAAPSAPRIFFAAYPFRADAVSRRFRLNASSLPPPPAAAAPDGGASPSPSGSRAMYFARSGCFVPPEFSSVSAPLFLNSFELLVDAEKNATCAANAGTTTVVDSYM